MSNIYTHIEFYVEVSKMSSNNEDIDYEEMVALEYIEVNHLGMKPVIAAMCDVLFIPEFIDQFIGPLDPRVKISIGVLIKAMIINVLMGRTPLVHVENTFSQYECEILLGQGINPNDLNDDRLGDAIEKLGGLEVLVSLYICYRIDSSLRNEEDPVKETPPAVKEKDIVKKGYTAGQRILTSDGRLVEKPTYKVIFGVLSSLKVLGTFHGEKLVCKFGYGTPIRLF